METLVVDGTALIDSTASVFGRLRNNIKCYGGKVLVSMFNAVPFFLRLTSYSASYVIVGK